jgi:tRNA modification GTPase
LLVCEPSAGASEIVGLWRVGDLFVLNKSDLMWEAPELPGHSIAVSAKTEEGLSDLIAWIGQRAAAMSGRTGSAILTRARHREALEAAQGSLVSGIAALGSGLELAAEHLRMSARAIGRITGKVDVEDVLDVVFRDFCIGK